MKDFNNRKIMTQQQEQEQKKEDSHIVHHQIITQPFKYGKYLFIESFPSIVSQVFFPNILLEHKGAKNFTFLKGTLTGLS